MGDLDLAYDTLDLSGEPGVAMTIYTAEPGSPTQQPSTSSPAGLQATRDHPGFEQAASVDGWTTRRRPI